MYSSLQKCQSFCPAHNKTLLVLKSEPWFNINMSSYQYRKSHCGDKTVVRLSYLHNGISYTGKMTSLYWIRALNIWGELYQNHGCWCLGSLHCYVISSVGALAPCNVRSSTILLNMWDKWVLCFHVEEYQLPVPSQCWEMAKKNVSTLSFLRNKIQTRVDS